MASISKNTKKKYFVTPITGTLQQLYESLYRIFIKRDEIQYYPINTNINYSKDNYLYKIVDGKLVKSTNLFKTSVDTNTSTTNTNISTTNTNTSTTNTSTTNTTNTSTTNTTLAEEKNTVDLANVDLTDVDLNISNIKVEEKENIFSSYEKYFDTFPNLYFNLKNDIITPSIYNELYPIIILNDTNNNNSILIYILINEENTYCCIRQYVDDISSAIYEFAVVEKVANTFDLLYASAIIPYCSGNMSQYFVVKDLILNQDNKYNLEISLLKKQITDQNKQITELNDKLNELNDKFIVLDKILEIVRNDVQEHDRVIYKDKGYF